MATETQKELLDKYEWIKTEFYAGTFDLNNWECDFLATVGIQLNASDGFLTELQIEKLEEIYDKYNR